MYVLSSGLSGGVKRPREPGRKPIHRERPVRPRRGLYRRESGKGNRDEKIGNAAKESISHDMVSQK